MEPVTGSIQKAEAGRSGKSLRVQINGQWFSSKEFALQQMVGQVITFTPSPSEYNGKTYYWINDWNEGTAGVTSTNAQGQPVAPSAERKDPTTYLPITSNLVAHAIAAGLIKDPGEVRQWAKEAFTVAKDLCEPQDEFDDDIPF